MFKIIILALIPGILLIIQNGLHLNDSSQLLDQRTKMKDDLIFTLELGTLIHKIQIERGTSAMYVTSEEAPIFIERLLSAYTDTDQAIYRLSKWVTLTIKSQIRTKRQYHQWIRAQRQLIMYNSSTLENVLDFYTPQIDAFTAWVINSMKTQRRTNIWTELVAFYLLLVGKEQTGIERALGATFYATGGFHLTDLLWYNSKYILGANFLRESSAFNAHCKSLISSEYTGSKLNSNVDEMRNDILTNSSVWRSPTQGTTWFDNMTEYIDILKRVQDCATSDIAQKTDDEIHDLKLDVIFGVLQMAVALVLVPSIVCLIYRISQKLSKVADELQEKTENLQSEQKRTESLLSQIVPKTIARKLKIYHSVKPESYESVTVLYGDIFDMPAFCVESSPADVLHMLNKLDRVVENRLDAYTVNKIGTLGNAFLVTAGLPEKIGGQHAKVIAMLALDLMQKVSDIQGRYRINPALQLRIGIATGSVLAGVVGNGTPRYCIVGNTVSQAVAMEITGKPMQIQITDSTHRELLRYPQFSMKERTSSDPAANGCFNGRSFWLTARKAIKESQSIVDHEGSDC